MEEKKLPEYEIPKVVSYTDEEILEELGPAQTGSGGPALGGGSFL